MAAQPSARVTCRAVPAGYPGAFGQAFDVSFIDDRVFPGNLRPRFRRPQLKVSSMTVALGMARALSRRSKDRSSRGLPVR